MEKLRGHSASGPEWGRGGSVPYFAIPLPFCSILTILERYTAQFWPRDSTMGDQRRYKLGGDIGLCIALVGIGTLSGRRGVKKL